MADSTGTKNTTEIPAEIQGWNWGAFLLSWIWGIGNNTPRAWLAAVPCFGLIMCFVLGIKGNEWAWQNGKWRSVEQFRASQRRWAWAGVATYAAFAVLAGLGWVGMSKMMGGVTELALSRLENDAEIASVFGKPLETGMTMGSVEVAGPAGTAKVSFDLEGPKASGTVYLNATKSLGQWTIDELEVAVDGRDERIELVRAH